MKSTASFHLALLACLGLSSLSAQSIEGPPSLIDYQGRLLNESGEALDDANTIPGNGQNFEIRFRIWDDISATDSTNLIWAEKQTVTVVDGNFSVRLGEGQAITLAEFDTLPLAGEIAAGPTALADAFDGKERYLGVTVMIPGETPAEITPRLSFLSAPYAMTAATAVNAQNAVTAQTATNAEMINGGTDAVITASTTVEINSPSLTINNPDNSRTSTLSVDSNNRINGQFTGRFYGTADYASSAGSATRATNADVATTARNVSGTSAWVSVSTSYNTTGGGVILYGKPYIRFVNQLTANYGMYTVNTSNRLQGSFAGTMYSSSDERLKENFVPLNGALDVVEGITPQFYNFKSQEDTDIELGVIAQELQDVLPSAVTDEGDPSASINETNCKTVDYKQLSVLAIGAIKEQQAIIESQQEKIDSLEERLAAIEELLSGQGE